jgi:hypothetical protein
LLNAIALYCNANGYNYKNQTTLTISVDPNAVKWIKSSSAGVEQVKSRVTKAHDQEAAKAIDEIKTEQASIIGKRAGM